MNDYKIGMFLSELQEELEKHKEKELEYLKKESELLESKTLDHLKGAIKVNYQEKQRTYSKGIEDSISIIEKKRREFFSKEMEKKDEKKNWLSRENSST